MNAIKWQGELRANLRALMSDHGFKHRHLAEILGLPVSHTSNRLNAQWFSRSEVETLASHFEMSVDELMGNSSFKDEAAQHNARLKAEAREARYRAAQERIAAEQAERKAQEELRRFGARALCCECGALRRVDIRQCGKLEAGKTTALGSTAAVGRLVGTGHCETCQMDTRHAVLADTVADRDMLERSMYKPSPQQEAATKRDVLFARIAGLNVDIRYRSLGRRKHRTKHGVPIVGVEYDASKSQWRVEINPDVPASLQLLKLDEVWNMIAADDADWWDDMDRENGAWTYASTDEWASVADDLVEEITRAMGPQRGLMALDARQATDKAERRDA